MSIKNKASGILIYSFNNENKLVFLLGKENKSKKYCDFGGGKENNETDEETAIREFDEESMRSIMTIEEITNKIKNDSFNVVVNNYREYVVKIDYNEYIPQIYNRIRDKLDICMLDMNGKYQIPTCPNGFLEKSEMRWFTINDLKKEINNLRPVFKPTLYVVLKKLLEEKKKN